MLVIATLNDRLQPFQRAELYDQPLHHLLTSRNVGAVGGGGTLQGADGEVESVDVEIELGDPERLPLLAQAFEVLGAPRGSVLRADGQEVPFGRLEGLGLYLNGVDLPAEVYATSDVNAVLERLEELLSGAGELHGYWEGPRETALYFYGDSYTTMQARIDGFLGEHPLCRMCRVVQVA